MPMPPMLLTDEVEFLLRDSNATAIVADEDMSEVACSSAARLGIPAHVVTRDFVAYGEIEQGLESAVPRDPMEPAVLFYTSGTTGRPKGAVLTHLNLVMNGFVNAFMANRLEKDDVVLGCLPLFHTFGQTVSMNSSFLVGAKVVLQRRFDAGEALCLMREHEVSVLIGVPTMYMALLDAVGFTVPPKLRMCISGGAPLPVAALEEFQERFQCVIQEGYGLSETSPTATVNQVEYGLKPGSVGHPLWGVEVEIANPEIEHRTELHAPEVLGEVVIRGHNLFSGYYRQPATTSTVIVDGWFRTGDLGVKDSDGFVHIIDRKKDMILRGGYNVYPREIEEVLARHPSIAQVAVAGVPDDRLGEEVLAAIVLDATKPGVTVDELRAWIHERIASHKRPRIIKILEELPVGPTRKILKRELRTAYVEGRLGSNE